MTRDANPIVFWCEVAVFAFIGAALLDYGLAGLLGYSDVTATMVSVAGWLPEHKFQRILIGALILMQMTGLGWFVVDELHLAEGGR